MIVPCVSDLSNQPNIKFNESIYTDKAILKKSFDVVVVMEYFYNVHHVEKDAF